MLRDSCLLYTYRTRSNICMYWGPNIVIFGVVGVVFGIRLSQSEVEKSGSNVCQHQSLNNAVITQSGRHVNV
jgi:hypothetical protein